MGMSHADCTHERTPAGRAACRRAGGPAAAPDALPAGATRVPNSRIVRLVAVEPRGRQLRTRTIAGIGDMDNVPASFGSIIRYAWDKGWTVQTAHPYNDDERRITIKSDAGTASLVWRSATPCGVNAVWFRPARTSVWTRLDGAPILDVTVRRLAGES